MTPLVRGTVHIGLTVCMKNNSGLPLVLPPSLSLSLSLSTPPLPSLLLPSPGRKGVFVGVPQSVKLGFRQAPQRETHTVSVHSGPSLNIDKQAPCYNQLHDLRHERAAPRLGRLYSVKSRGNCETNTISACQGGDCC